MKLPNGAPALTVEALRAGLAAVPAGAILTPMPEGRLAVYYADGVRLYGVFNLELEGFDPAFTADYVPPAPAAAPAPPAPATT